MDVRMPDGTVITNVPEGITKSQLIAKLDAFKAAQAQPAQPTKPSSLLERAGDIGVSLAQGAVGLGEAAIGLADIPTMGYAGKAAEAAEKALFGGTSRDLQAYLQSKKTPEAQAAERKVQEAKGFFNTLGEYVEYPSTILGTIAESAPSMIGGAGVARLGMGAAKKLGKEIGAATAAAAGEGVVSAGSTAESIRQQVADGTLSAGQAGIAAVSGVLTAGFGKFGSKVADKLGIDDIDVIFAGGRKVAKGKEDKATKSVLAAAIKGAISESVFEELPQSMQEQIAQNIALDKPWDENVAEAGASGFIAALGMGGAGSAASQVLTNANIKAEEKRAALAQESKPGKSMLDLQDEEDAGIAPTSTPDYTVDAQGNTVPVSEAARAKQQTAEADTQKTTQQTTPESNLTPEAEELLKSVADGGVPAMMTNNLKRIARENGIQVTPQDTPNSVIEKLQAKRQTKQQAKQPAGQTYYDVSFTGKVRPVDEELLDERGLPYFSEKRSEEEEPFDREAFRAQMEEDKATLAKLKEYFKEREAKKLPGFAEIEDEYRRASAAYKKAESELARIKAISPDYWLYSDESIKANKAMDRWMQASSNLRKAEEGIEFEGYQKPLFGEQKGLDLGEPTSERAVQVTAPSSMPTIGQMGLNFNAQVSEDGTVEPVPVKEEKATFGMTTPVTAKPLEDFLSIFKPKSSSEVERTKQQNALFGVRDEQGRLKTSGLLDKIKEVYEDVPTEERGYYMELINSFFDKYASKPLPSRQADFKNLNNLNAQDQRSVIEKHLGRSFPDLTTYEGVKKLTEEFEDHIADAQLAGLGITRSSSAYKQIDPVVRQLRSKPKTEYTDEEQAAYDYLSMFDLDLALRSAAFDLATNTPRNQLYRGQGKEFAEKFQSWISKNAPEKVTKQFENYVRAYRKANEGYNAFLALQDNAEAEAAYRQSYVEGKQTPYYGQRTTGAPALHPGIRGYILNNDMNGLLRLMTKQSRTPYGKQLATRLLSLNLPTSIGFNKVSDVVRNWEPTFNRVLARFVEEQKVLSPQYASDLDALLSYAQDTEVSQDKYQTILKDLLRLRHLSKARQMDMTSTTGYYNQLAKIAKDAVDSYTSPGVYFGKEDAISINTSMDQNGENIYNIMHEIMHAATANIIDGVQRDPSKYTEKQRKAVDEIYKLYYTALKAPKTDGSFYGMRNAHEFVAEAFTNPDFQKYLQGIAYKQSDRSLWDKFVEFCMKLFGMDNVLSSTVAAVNDLFGAPRNSVAANSVSTPYFDKKMIKMFESNSEERSGPFDFFKSIFRNVKTFGNIKDNLARELETANSQTRKTWLGALTLRQINEVIGTTYSRNPETGKLEVMSKLPQISEYISAVETMRKDVFDKIEYATDISKRLLNIQRDAPETVKLMGQIIQTATVEDVDVTSDTAPIPLDPTKVTPVEQRRMLAYKELRAEFLKLGQMKNGEAAQQIYADMFKFFKDSLKEFKRIAVEREEARLQSAYISKVSKDEGPAVARNIDFTSPNYKDEADRLAAQARDNIDKKYPTVIENYFPLKRFGDFWARVGSGKNRRYYQFESARARDNFVRKEQAKLARELQRQGKDSLEIGKAINDPANINYKNSLPDLISDMFTDKAVYEQVRELVAQAGISAEGVENITDPQELRDIILDKLGEVWVTTLPSQSIAKMFMHRENVPGASADIIRSFQHAAFHLAYQQGRFKYGPQMDDILLAAKGYIRAMANTEEGAVLSDYLTEVDRRHKEQVIKPPPSAPWANYLSNMNFLWYLTAPASAIVNMLAVPSIALPVIGAKYGTAKAAARFMRNMRLLAGSGTRDKNGNFDAPSLLRAKGITDVQLRALNMASESLLEQSLAHDAAGIAENPSLDYSGKWGKIMQLATFPFHKAERFNREITFLTAFDLAYERNGGNLEAAVKEASDITWKTMFDYATYNKPRFVKGDLARVLFAFKQYAQHMTYLLFRTAYDATSGVDKDEFDAVKAQYGEEAAKKYAVEMKEINKEARRTFLMLMGMSFLFAGASGLPIWWLLKGIGNAFHAVFGDDEEGWDFNNAFKNKMTEVFGGFAGDSISRGVIPQLTGASLSQRMSINLGDMWFRDTRKNLDEVSWFQETMINLLGPSVGIGVNAMEAIKRYKDGYPERAMEAIAPAAFKNILAGSRLASEGALTMKGDTLLESVTGTEAFLQMLGFTPERLAQRQQANIEAKSVEQAILDKKQNILNLYAMAVDNDDEEAIDKVLERIDEFNDKNPEFAITGRSLKSSMSRRAKNKAMADSLGGVRVNPKFAERAEELMGYAEDTLEEE